MIKDLPPIDKQRGLAALEDPVVRNHLISGLDQDFLERMIAESCDPEQVKAYLRIGADPRFSISTFISDFETHNRLIRESNKNKVNQEHKLASSDTEELERITRSIVRETKICERSRKRLSGMRERNSIEKLYVLIDCYLENRSTRRSKYYLPFDRAQLLELLKWLLMDDQVKRAEQLILIENLYSKKFTISQQRKYDKELAYVREYWSNRKAKMDEVLSDFLPKDLAKMTAKIRL